MKYSQFLIVLLLVASLTAFAESQSQTHQHSKMHKSSDTLLVKGAQQATEKEMYTCPMHPKVMSDKPGKCPQCGMALKKKGSSKVKTQSVSYVCPMHSEVVSDKPGTCSKCGMKLRKAKTSTDIKSDHKNRKGKQ